MPATVPEALLRGAIDVFIVLFLVYAWCWDLRPDSPYAVARRFKKYIYWLSLHHSWKLFAPDVSRVDPELRVMIALSNGRQAIWTPPRLGVGDCGLLRDFVGYRHRKFQFKLRSQTEHSYQRSMIEYFVRRYTDGDVRPIRISFVVVRHAIPEPGAPAAAPSSRPFLVSRYRISRSTGNIVRMYPPYGWLAPARASEPPVAANAEVARR